MDIGNGLWEEVDYMSTVWSREPCGNEFLKGSCGHREWIVGGGGLYEYCMEQGAMWK